MIDTDTLYTELSGRDSPYTNIGPEEAAYPAGSLRQSRRYGRLLCADGRVRRAKIGIPDTYSTIPAIVRIRGKSVHGYAYMHTDTNEYRFQALGKNRSLSDWTIQNVERLAEHMERHATPEQ